MIRRYVHVAIVMTCLYPAVFTPVVAQTPAAQMQDILGPFEGSLANMPAARFQDFFPQATEGFTQDQIQTFLDAFGQSPASGQERLSREFLDYSPQIQRDIVTLIAIGMTEHTRGPVGRLVTRATGLMGIEALLTQIVSGELDGREYVFFLDKDMANFLADYPTASSLVFTPQRLAEIMGKYEYQVSLLQAYIAEMEAQIEANRAQIEAYDRSIEAMREQILFLRALQDAT